jgi:hypothetical protein
MTIMLLFHGIGLLHFPPNESENMFCISPLLFRQETINKCNRTIVRIIPRETATQHYNNRYAKRNKCCLDHVIVTPPTVPEPYQANADTGDALTFAKALLTKKKCFTFVKCGLMRVDGGKCYCLWLE